MSKIKLFLDFDEVLCDSIPCFVEVYNERYNENVDHTKLKQYNFKDICPLLKGGEVQDIFGCDRFWELLKPKEDCLNVLNRKVDKFEYILVSIGNPRNLYMKSKYVVKNFPVIEQMILITNKHNKMNKELIKMDGIFIDDHIDNLNSSSADVKICFRDKVYDWNKDWTGLTVKSWKELDILL